MAELLCSECIEDEYLREILKTEGEPGHCDECEEDRPYTVSIERMGEIIAPVLRQNIAHGSDSYDGQEGDPLEHFVQEMLGQYLNCNDELVEAVISSENCRPHRGDECFFDTDTNYVYTRASAHILQIEWASLRNDLVHRRRFFSNAAKSFFDELFADVDTLLTHPSGRGKTEDRGVVVTLPTGTALYRGRICNSEDSLDKSFKEPFEHVGPPPPQKASAGRMNAEGISMFYGATDESTCLAELRPALTVEAAIIRVATTKPLRILDFTRLERAYKALSYFQQNFEEEAERFAFLRKLGKLISQPIIPGHEIDYLITQTMMEYLAHVHATPFDGVYFSSAQHKGGVNIVLFPDRTEDHPVFPIDYVVGSIEILRIESISYKHTKVPYRLYGDEVVRDFEWDDPEDD